MKNAKRTGAAGGREKCETGAGASAGKRAHAKKRTVSKEKLVECCRRSNGILSVVSTMLGVSWHTAEKYIKACPEAQEAFSDAKEMVKDVAESALLRILNNPNHPRHFDAVTFALKTQGKDRGYTEKIENEVSGDLQPPVLNILIEKGKAKT